MRPMDKCVNKFFHFSVAIKRAFCYNIHMEGYVHAAKGILLVQVPSLWKSQDADAPAGHCTG